jgi:hypothetical protein
MRDVKLIAYHLYLSRDESSRWYTGEEDDFPIPSLQNAIFVSSLLIRTLSIPNKFESLFKLENAESTTQFSPLMEDLLSNLDMHSGGFPLVRMLQGPQDDSPSCKDVFLYVSHINALCNVLAFTMSARFGRGCVLVFFVFCLGFIQDRWCYYCACKQDCWAHTVSFTFDVPSALPFF